MSIAGAAQGKALIIHCLKFEIQLVYVCTYVRTAAASPAAFYYSMKHMMTNGFAGLRATVEYAICTFLLKSFLIITIQSHEGGIHLDAIFSMCAVVSQRPSWEVEVEFISFSELVNTTKTNYTYV